MLSTLTPISLKDTSRERRRTYRRDWARNQRRLLKESLLNLLGNKCVNCGATEDLEFDHIHATKTYTSCRMASLDRLRRYQEEISRGEIQLLCGPCNRKKGVPRPPEDLPF